MARNQAKTFATMNDDERNRLAGADGEQDAGGALAFDDPRDTDRMGRHYATVSAEVSDPDNRDGTAADLDDAAHERAVGRDRHRNRRDRSGVNVGRTERLVSGIAGAAIVAFSLKRRTMRGVLLPLGGGLIARAVTGRCPVNKAIGRDTSGNEKAPSSPVTSVGRGQGVKLEKSVTINRPVDELFSFWRDFENLPRFMDHLESVQVIDSRRSHWVAKAPAGQRVEWDAEIHNEIPNELIAWRSLPGSEIANAGSVHFRPSPSGQGTEVRVVLSYEPPAGRLGDAVAKLFGEAPSQQVEDDLRRFKQVMEGSVVPVVP